MAALARAPQADVTYIAIEPAPLSVRALRLNLLGTDGQGKDSFFSLNASSSSISSIDYSHVLSSSSSAAAAAVAGPSTSATALGSAAKVSGKVTHTKGTGAPGATAAAGGAAAAGAAAAAGTAAGPEGAAAGAEAAPAPAAAAAAGGGGGGADVPQRISPPYPGNISIISAAVSDVAKGAAQMTFYPYMPGNSTLRTKEKEMLQKKVRG